MDTCNSNYTPQLVASFFHQIPHVNTSLLETSDMVAGTLGYFEAVIIWGCLPALVAVIVFTLLMVYNCLVCYCCCPNEMYNAKKKAVCCGVVTGIGVGACFLFLAGALFVEVELGRSVDKFVKFVESSASYQEQTVILSYSLSGQGLEQTMFRDSLNDVVGDPSQLLADEAAALRATTDQLNSNLTVLRDMATQFMFTPTSGTLPIVETARHWTVLGLLILLTLVMVVVLIGVVCARVRFLLCTMVTLTLAMIVTWLGVVLGMVGTMVVADFCADPDGTLRATQDPSLAAQVDYYLVCGSDCTSSTDVLLSDLEELYVTVDAQVMLVEEQIGNGGSMAMDSFEIVKAILENSNSTFQALKEGVFSCEAINRDEGLVNVESGPIPLFSGFYSRWIAKDSWSRLHLFIILFIIATLAVTLTHLTSTPSMYVSARDAPYTGPMADTSYSLCGSGMIFMVALFGVFIFLVFSMVLVLCCGTAYFGFIRATEEEGLYDFSQKTDSFLPKNFAGDYASSTWTRPQPAMLGGGLQSSGGAFTTTVEVEQQRPGIGYEMHQFNTMDSQGMEERARSEPPQYNDIVMNEQEVVPVTDSPGVTPNGFGMELEGQV